MTDYKELIKRREELREELANVNDEIDHLAKTIYKGKLEKAVALLREVNEAEIFNEEEIDYYASIEGIIDGIESYIDIIEERS